MLARGATLDRAFELAHEPPHDGLIAGEHTGDKIARLFHGRIHVSERWLSPSDSTDALIDGADVFDGLRYFRMEDVIAYKRRLDRAKDRSDLAAIDGHLNRKRLAPSRP